MTATNIVRKLRNEYPFAQSIVPSTSIPGGYDVTVNNEFDTEYLTFKAEGGKLRLIGLLVAEN